MKPKYEVFNSVQGVLINNVGVARTEGVYVCWYLCPTSGVSSSLSIRENPQYPGSPRILVYRRYKCESESVIEVQETALTFS